MFRLPHERFTYPCSLRSMFSSFVQVLSLGRCARPLMDQQKKSELFRNAPHSISERTAAGTVCTSKLEWASSDSPAACCKTGFLRCCDNDQELGLLEEDVQRLGLFSAGCAMLLLVLVLVYSYTSCEYRSLQYACYSCWQSSYSLLLSVTIVTLSPLLNSSHSRLQVSMGRTMQAKSENKRGKPSFSTQSRSTLPRCTSELLAV